MLSKAALFAARTLVSLGVGVGLADAIILYTPSTTELTPSPETLRTRKAVDDIMTKKESRPRQMVDALMEASPDTPLYVLCTVLGCPPALARGWCAAREVLCWAVPHAMHRRTAATSGHASRSRLWAQRWAEVMSAQVS